MSNFLSKSGQPSTVQAVDFACPVSEIQNKIDAETVTLRTLQAMKRSTEDSLSQLKKLINDSLRRLDGLRRERAANN